MKTFMISTNGDQFDIIDIESGKKKSSHSTEEKAMNELDKLNNFSRTSTRNFSDFNFKVGDTFWTTWDGAQLVRIEEIDKNANAWVYIVDSDTGKNKTFVEEYGEGPYRIPLATLADLYSPTPYKGKDKYVTKDNKSFTTRNTNKFSRTSTLNPSDFVKKNMDKGVLASNYTLDLLVKDNSPRFVLKVWERTVKGYRIVPESNNTEIQLIVDLEKKIVTERIKGYMSYPDSFKNVSNLFSFSDDKGKDKFSRNARMNYSDMYDPKNFVDIEISEDAAMDIIEAIGLTDIDGTGTYPCSNIAGGFEVLKQRGNTYHLKGYITQFVEEILKRNNINFSISSPIRFKR